jgi:hypothetical protein
MTFDEWWAEYLERIPLADFIPLDGAARDAWNKSRIELMLDLALEKDAWKRGNVLDIWDIITKLTFTERQKDGTRL